MPHAEDTRVVPYAPEQMFDLVADVRRYPEFLPWCKALRIRSEEVTDEGRGLERKALVSVSDIGGSPT